MTRLIHTGDTHLGYQQYHRPERREDFLQAFHQVAADAVEADVDAVVHAGDLFHDRQPRLDDIMGAMSVLRTLADAGIPFLAVVGNHEGKRDRQWLDLFASLDLATRLGHEPEIVGDVAVYGQDFVPRSTRDSLEYEFADSEAAVSVLVSHGRFAPFEFGTWDAREILEESPVAFDALLLGDEHAPVTKRLDSPHECWLTYCGSTERASASEREDRGYNLVTVDEDGLDIRRRGLETRPFVFVDVELGPGEGAERVRQRVDQHDVVDAVVIVTLTGDGETVMPADVESYVAEQGALVTRVNDRRETTEEEADVSVDFADPDRAVEERLSDLGLSPAARDIDETIRASGVADSNVAAVVEERVRSLVEDGDEKDFTPAPAVEEDADEEDESAVGVANCEDGEEGETDAADGEDGEEGETDTVDGECDVGQAVAVDADADSQEVSTPFEPDPGEQSGTTDDERGPTGQPERPATDGERTEPSAETPAEASATEESADSDEDEQAQVTMEDYL